MDIPPQYGSGQTVEEAGVNFFSLHRSLHTYQITARANMSDYCTHTHQGFSAGVRQLDTSVWGLKLRGLKLRADGARGRCAIREKQ
jgi:hypothetical protein